MENSRTLFELALELVQTTGITGQSPKTDARDYFLDLLKTCRENVDLGKKPIKKKIVNKGRPSPAYSEPQQQLLLTALDDLIERRKREGISSKLGAYRATHETVETTWSRLFGKPITRRE